MHTSQEEFDLFIKRTKELLKIKTDKQLAGMLGMATTTFNTRKKNLNFPDIELRALSTKNPQLPIDFDYIYSGIPSSVFEQDLLEGGIAAFATDLLEPIELSDEEKQLIRLFRIVDKSGKSAVLISLEGMAYKKEHSPYVGILDEVKQHKEQLEKALKAKNETNVSVENAGQIITVDSVKTISNSMEIKSGKNNKNR